MILLIFPGWKDNNFARATFALELKHKMFKFEEKLTLPLKGFLPDNTWGLISKLYTDEKLAD